MSDDSPRSRGQGVPLCWCSVNKWLVWVAAGRRIERAGVVLERQDGFGVQINCMRSTIDAQMQFRTGQVFALDNRKDNFDWIYRCEASYSTERQITQALSRMRSLWDRQRSEVEPFMLLHKCKRPCGRPLQCLHTPVYADL